MPEMTHSFSKILGSHTHHRPEVLPDNGVDYVVDDREN